VWCWWKRQAVLVLHTDRKHQAFRVAGSERVRCTNASRMGNSNSSFTAKSCACVFVAFLACIISLSVD
jgi:hypothetical protein